MIFDIKFKPKEAGIDEGLALIQLFSYTDAICFSDGSRLQYQSGNYDKRNDEIWTGMIQMQRTGTPSSGFKDPVRGWRFAEESKTVITSKNTSIYAYDPLGHVIAYHDRSYTLYVRFRSYVQAAVRAYSIANPATEFSLDIVPRTSDRTIPEWINYLTSVDSVTTDYGHSRSPGDRLVDISIEKYNASRIRNAVRAKKGSSLNKAEIVNKELPLGRELHHIEVNEANGHAIISGKLGDDGIVVDSADPVERRKMETARDPKEIAATLATAARDATRRQLPPGPIELTLKEGSVDSKGKASSGSSGSSETE